MTVRTAIVTGLPATGKTLACEVLQAAGLHFVSPYGESVGAALEHPHMQTWYSNICTRHTDKAANPHLSRYNATKHRAGVLFAKERLPEKRPDASKCVFPAVVPIVSDVLQPDIIIWCTRDYTPWYAYLDSIHYPWRGADPMEAHHYDRSLMQYVAKTQSCPVIVFDVDAKQFTPIGSDAAVTTTFNRLLPDLL